MRKTVKAYLMASTEQALDSALRRAFPLGHNVNWMHGPYLQNGYVRAHGRGDRLKAYNFNTDHEVWVHGQQIRKVGDKELL